ncbi:MAG TPA: protein lplB [Clostridiaceae bacterium]|nr:protein lplB [Clostridiaceae bacterium]
MYRQRYLMLMSIPFIIWIFVFSFGPMYGWLMAFQDFDPNKGIVGSTWVGLKQFKLFFHNAEALRAVRNTVVISSMNIVLNNIVPLILALMLNEVGNMFFKSTVQTISYLPHFVSFVVVANLFLTLFGTQGPVNDLLVNIHLVAKPIKFWMDKNIFWYMVSFVNIWKEVGWGAIIYLASIAGVDPEIYEAATVDGCGRFKKMWYITIPSIMPTVIILWILSLGDIFNAGFDASYLLGNPATRNTADVIATYVYRYGIAMGMYSFSTAVSLIQTFIGFILVFFSNTISRKFTGYSLW